MGKVLHGAQTFTHWVGEVLPGPPNLDGPGQLAVVKCLENVVDVPKVRLFDPRPVESNTLAFFTLSVEISLPHAKLLELHRSSSLSSHTLHL